jgi:hypothetical protein
MQTTIHNFTNKTKHSLSAAAVYEQLSKEATEKGRVSVKQWVAELRNQLTEYQKEYMILDRQLATGFYKLKQERDAKVERYDFLKIETERITFVVSRYNEHYGRMKTQQPNQPKQKKQQKVPAVPVPVPVQEPVFDDWEDAAEEILHQ